MTEPPDRPDDFALVYPFDACQSRGGPYEDESFVAGWQAGQIAAYIDDPTLSIWSGPVYRHLVHQVDLVAMHAGFNLTVDVHEEGSEWVTITLLREGAAMSDE